MSRLSMDHTSENNSKNDIVGQLGIEGIGFGGPGAWGTPGSPRRATPASATPLPPLRCTHGTPRSNCVIPSRGSMAIMPCASAAMRGVSSGLCGAFSEPRLLPVHQWIHYPVWLQRWQRLRLGQPAADASHRQATPGGCPADESAQLGLRRLRRRQLADDSTTTVNLGLRYEYTSPLYDLRETNSNLIFNSGVPSVFIGGENGYPTGLMYSNKHNVAPRVESPENLPKFGIMLRGRLRSLTPVDQNTWCNQRHNVPYVFPETQQADNFTPPASLLANTLNFGTPVLGKGALPATTVSFTAFDPHAPAEYIQQWNAQIERLSDQTLHSKSAILEPAVSTCNAHT